jgi:hypothetical protein
MTVRIGRWCLQRAALAAMAMVIVVAILLLAPGRAAAVTEFGQDVQINSNANTQKYPAAAAGPNGYIYVIWQDDRQSPGSTNDIYMARSTDNGSTFSAPVRVDDAPAGTDQLYPQIGVDSSGKLHAVWSDFRSGVNFRIYYANSTDNGTNWSPGVMVNFSASGGQFVPSIAADSAGNLYIVWDDGRSGNHIFFSRSVNGGTSWSAAVKLDSSTNAARYPWICCAPSGNLTVVWQDSRNPNSDVFTVSSGNGGASFSPEVNVTKNTSSSSQMWPRAGYDPAGNIHVAWDDNRFGNFGVFYGYSSDGLTFTGVPVNDTDTGISANPEPPMIAVDSNGVTHVCWQDKRGGSYNRIYYAEQTGPGTFAASVRVDNTTTANCHDPFVMVDQNNMPSVVWEDDRNINLDIFYDRPQNVPPSAPDLLDPAADVWVTTGRPSFNWTFRDINTSDAQSAYQLQMDNSSLFGSIDYDSGTVVSPVSTHTPATSVPDGIYFWRARTRDGSGLWGPYSPGRVIKIDTEAPAAGTPVDAGTWSNSSGVIWTWVPSSDSLSGLAGYHVCIGTFAGDSDVLADQWTTMPNFTYGGGTNGTTYFAKVKAQDNATNVGAYGGSSDGITVDVSVPDAATPVDGGQYVNGSLVRWSWPASLDFPSGIAGYYVSIGSAPGQDDISKDVWVTTNSTTYPAGQNGVTYYAMVKAKDNAGNAGVFGGPSDGITVDTSFPSCYTPVDNGTYSNSTTVQWAWPPAWDLPSGIKGYFVSVGTAYGGNDTVDGCFTASTAFTLAGAVGGKSYFCRILAQDNAGNIGPFSASSDGITVDPTGPSDMELIDDGPYTRSNSSLHAAWTSSFDDVSGVAEYLYCIGRAPGASDVAPWTSAGQALSVTRRNLTLQNGVSYYFSVKARNGANLWSQTSTAVGVTVDTSVPVASVPGFVDRDTGSVFYSTSTSIMWNWTPSADTPSGIKGYYICIGSTPGATDVVNDAFSADSFYTYASGQNGRSYYAKIKAVDNAGNIGGYGEDASVVVVDVSIPQASSPVDGGAYMAGASITFNWSPAEDMPSGIEGYYISIGTSPGGFDMVKDLWTTGTSYTLMGALGGESYFAMVKARDKAGNNGSYGQPSDGIIVDITPPSAAAVYGGGYLRNATTFPLSWSISYDNETPVVEYRYAIGTSLGASDVVSWTSAGLRLSIDISGLGLANGLAYHASVQARNAAGLWSDVSTGAAVTVDTVAPAAGAPVHAGAFANGSVVGWSWNASADAESGIAGYYVFIGSSPGGSDVVCGTWTQSSAFSFPGGINGAVYYASVAAQDRAGNVGQRSASGAGVTVDTSVPAAYPAAADFVFSAAGAFDWKWTPSQDLPSGIAGYFVSVGTFPGGEDAVKDLWIVTASYHFTAGKDGKTYYIKVKAKDNAGNVGDFALGTAGVTVDLSLPSGTVMMEGGAAATARRAVMLAISTNDTDVSEMAVSSDPGLTGASWEPFTPTRGWLLSEGDGQKTVYVKLRDRAGQESAVFSSTIRRDTIVAPFKLVSSAGDQTGDAGTTISGTVEPGSKVLVNGIMAQVAADGSFRQAVALQEGSNVIVVTVVDAAGNSQTLTMSVSRAQISGGLAGGMGSLLILVLALVATILVLVVLAVSLSTRRMLVAHLKAAPAVAAGAGKDGPHGGGKPDVAQKEPAGTAALNETPTEALAPAHQEGGPEGWVERPTTAGGEAGAEPPTDDAGTAPQESAASMIDALAAAARGSPGQEQAGYTGSSTGQPAEYSVSAGQGPAAFRGSAGQGPAAYDGDMVIRADGTEAAAPSEPRLVSEWSPDTGQWTPVSEEKTEGTAQLPAPQEPIIEDGPGEMAPEPTRALEDLARSFHSREERPVTFDHSHEAPPPVTAAPGQRRSAKEIYAALYGKRTVPPPGTAPAAPAKSPVAGGPATGTGAAGAPPSEERKVLGKARCAQCKGVIPIYSAERPLKIKCPACGLEGMIK